MSDDLVKRICQKWIDVGCADECFWEGWPECPTPEDSLTPRMVLDCIEALKANRLANRVAIMRLEAKLAKQDDLVQAAVAVRKAQKSYFKDRSRDNLIASKQAETALDKLLAELTGDKDD